MSRHIPSGWQPDHCTPSKFVVRCIDCGRLTVDGDRGNAHRRARDHGLACAQTAVTPISIIDEDAVVEPPVDTAALHPRQANLTGEEVVVVYRSKVAGAELKERQATVEEMQESSRSDAYAGFYATAENGVTLEIDLTAGIVYSHGNVRSPTGGFVRVEPACEDGSPCGESADDSRAMTDGGEQLGGER